MTTSEVVPEPLSDGEDGGIDVLLVDDNEQWAEFIARDLERESARLRVRTALSANGAIQQLTAEDGVECVVSDYRMPEIDGLQLLERIRDERPDLPFILVTGQGSEDVAKRAISAGVTDYIVKDPGRDQTPLFAARIERAVSEYRLRRAIEERERRYRTVTEQISEGIAIVRDGEMVFHNDRLLELADHRGEQIGMAEFLESVHPEERARVRRDCERLEVGESADDRPVVRFPRSDGETRFCVYSGRGIVYEGSPSTLLSIRDVTERRRRQRRLEWERDVNQVVQEVLVESRTREVLERRLCQVLTGHGYALAWVGLPDGDRLRPRASAGATSFLEGVELSLSGNHDGKPGVWAARSREAQFVECIEDLFPTEWRERALDHGLKSGGALPLVHNGVFYGVLVVYRDDRDGFDSVERELLEGLVDTLAFAVHNLEASRALASGSLVEVTVQVTGPSFYLNEVTERPQLRASGTTVTVDGTVPQEDSVVQYVTVDSGAVEIFEEVASDHPSVESVRIVSEDRGRVQVTVTEQTPASRLVSLGARVRKTTVDVGRATVRYELPATQDVRAAVDHLDGVYETVTVLSVVEADDDSSDPLVAVDGADLTDKQRDALRVAYHNGYFEQPRLSSATEVADALGISHSTFLQHLRVAQRKVFGERFG